MTTHLGRVNVQRSALTSMLEAKALMAPSSWCSFLSSVVRVTPSEKKIHRKVLQNKSLFQEFNFNQKFLMQSEEHNNKTFLLLMCVFFKT